MENLDRERVRAIRQEIISLVTSLPPDDQDRVLLDLLPYTNLGRSDDMRRALAQIPPHRLEVGKE